MTLKTTKFDITKFLKAGDNTIAVRVDNSKEPSARWYHPTGIYAPVALHVMDRKTHIKSNGVYVTTSLPNNRQ